MSGFTTRSFLLVVLLLGATALGQSNTDGIISGVITDEFGSLTPDVQIVAKTKDGNTVHAKSALNGTYELRLPKGIYSLTFKRPPFKTFSVAEYQISDDARMKLDVSLICEDCEPVESLSVDSQR